MMTFLITHSCPPVYLAHKSTLGKIFSPSVTVADPEFPKKSVWWGESKSKRRTVYIRVENGTKNHVSKKAQSNDLSLCMRVIWELPV
jgi:hypothetical protein